MKGFMFFIFCTLAVISNGQEKIWYVAAKSGLSIREKPDTKAPVISKIPYGTKITVTYPEAIVNIYTEGLEGAWAKTTYNGKTGYVVNSYLLPLPPPKTTVKTMKEYLGQVSVPAGAAVVVEEGSIEELESGGSSTKKQLYKNGAEYHEVKGYEWNNDVYFLPGFTVQQGFILLRLIPEFKSVFAETDPFPVKNKTIKREEGDYSIKVEMEKIGEVDWVKRITIEYAEGAYYTFEIFQLSNQLVISFGGGV